MKVRFLADANFDQDIVSGLWRRRPEVEFALPQEFIPDGTGDPEVLAIASGLDAILVTHDVRTMPLHFANFVKGSRSPGLIIVPSRLAIATVIDELALIWEASSPDDWIDQYRRLPL